MEGITNLKSVRLNMESLFSIHKLNEIMEYLVNTTNSNIFNCEINYDAKDNNGPHWSGYRCFLKDKKSDLSLYIHFGLIYLPETKIGLMVELDRGSNPDYYEEAWNKIEEFTSYDLNKDEKDYLKLFYPESLIENLNEGTDVKKQVYMIKDYFIASCEALLKAVK